MLTGARLSLWLALDGHLVLDGEDLSDEVLGDLPAGQLLIGESDQR